MPQKKNKRGRLRKNKKYRESKLRYSIYNNSSDEENEKENIQNHNIVKTEFYPLINEGIILNHKRNNSDIPLNILNNKNEKMSDCSLIFDDTGRNLQSKKGDINFKPSIKINANDRKSTPITQLNVDSSDDDLTENDSYNDNSVTEISSSLNNEYKIKRNNSIYRGVNKMIKKNNYFNNNDNIKNNNNNDINQWNWNGNLSNIENEFNNGSIPNPIYKSSIKKYNLLNIDKGYLSDSELSNNNSIKEYKFNKNESTIGEDENNTIKDNSEYEYEYSFTGRQLSKILHELDKMQTENSYFNYSGCIHEFVNKNKNKNKNNNKLNTNIAVNDSSSKETNGIDNIENEDNNNTEEINSLNLHSIYNNIINDDKMNKTDDLNANKTFKWNINSNNENNEIINESSLFTWNDNNNIKKNNKSLNNNNIKMINESSSFVWNNNNIKKDKENININNIEMMNKSSSFSWNNDVVPNDSNDINLLNQSISFTWNNSNRNISNNECQLNEELNTIKYENNNVLIDKKELINNDNEFNWNRWKEKSNYENEIIQSQINNYKCSQDNEDKPNNSESNYNTFHEDEVSDQVKNENELANSSNSYVWNINNKNNININDDMESKIPNKPNLSNLSINNKENNNLKIIMTDELNNNPYLSLKPKKLSGYIKNVDNNKRFINNALNTSKNTLKKSINNDFISENISRDYIHSDTDIKRIYFLSKKINVII
ncbi:hypothetical protein LY90DRAFT_510100 [Neocallimastix californiae]|uniref:Uncharacterized protein n=1 Tax=Neocallimastix californiae TaxID=1754190 RepID=A0A1Y2C415_9FUNG|nr:hypothetical protein LY90DRAFT_510100 [Neocallimastix californiae]|eukprot:ORY41769.1 hypothetical protein LY90DRAFT_510100 [Neocallimastix californiae]